MDINTNELYSTRLLIFMETDAQSNEYNQVFVNKNQFKKISDAICLDIKPADAFGIQEVEINLSNETYQLPDLQEIHENNHIV